MTIDLSQKQIFEHNFFSFFDNTYSNKQFSLSVFLLSHPLHPLLCDLTVIFLYPPPSPDYNSYEWPLIYSDQSISKNVIPQNPYISIFNVCNNMYIYVLPLYEVNFWSELCSEFTLCVAGESAKLWRWIHMWMSESFVGTFIAHLGY